MAETEHDDRGQPGLIRNTGMRGSGESGCLSFHNMLASVDRGQNASKQIIQKENIMEQNVLAIVAGREITEADLNAFLESAPKEHQAYVSNPQFRRQYLEQLISLHSFAKMGEELKLEETEEFQKILESAKRDILAQLAIRETLKDVEVTEEEAVSYYESNQKQFEKGEAVRAKHILTAGEEGCLAALDAITRGEKTFEELAKEISTCPSGAKGGDLGEFGKGQMVKEFEEAAFAAEPGHVVGPVKTQFGYHLIKVEEKKEAEATPFSEVKDMIIRNLTQQKQNHAYAAKAKELREKYVQE